MARRYGGIAVPATEGNITEVKGHETASRTYAQPHAMLWCVQEDVGMYCLGHLLSGLVERPAVC